MSAQPIFWNGFGLDAGGQMWVRTDQGAQPVQGHAHPLAHKTGLEAFCWMLDMDRVWTSLTPHQRRALANPEKPGLRCLPALTERGLIDGTTRTNSGELLIRFSLLIERRRAAA